MPAPSADEPEWIEIFNTAEIDVNFSKLTIINQNSSKTFSNITFKANSYTILTADTLLFLSKRKLPTNTQIIKAALPTLHNTYDPIVIQDESGNVIDSIYYDMKWGKKGISFERIDHKKPAVSEENIGISKSKDSATAGYINSIAIADFGITSFFKKTESSIFFFIKNAGRKPIGFCDLKFSIDKNGDSLIHLNEEFLIKKVNPTEKLDSFEIPIINLVMQCENPGWKKLYCEITDSIKSLEFKISVDFYKSYSTGTIIVNEFLYDESDSSAEFIEFYNTSVDSVSLYGWSVFNKHSTQGFDTIFIDKMINIKPKEYFVLVWDSLFFNNFPELAGNQQILFVNSNMNLKVSSDEINLLDANLMTQDRLSYTEDWKNFDIGNSKNISLERINYTKPTNESGNWSSCGFYPWATPLKQNSVSKTLSDLIKINADPNPFSPIDPGSKTQTKISYHLPFHTSRIQATVFYPDGIVFTELLNNTYTSSEGYFIWDGKDSKGTNATAGPYILLLEAVDTFSGTNSTGKYLIVIGR